MTESGISTKTTAFTSGTSSVDALLDNFSWTGTVGQGATVTYNFNFNRFSSADQQAAISAMSQWAKVANVNFVYQANGADMTFTRYSFTDPFLAGEASISYTGTEILEVEVRLDDDTASVTQGTDGYYTLLHEIGHALGLKHPGNYSSGDTGPFLSSSEDTYNATVMSYNTAGSLGGFPISPMVYDIAAIQYLYGANLTATAGNTEYRISATNNATQTLYDSGGFDVLSASSFNNGSSGVTIDLRGGLGVYSQFGNQYTFIAENTTIEMAEGSIGNDRITGNLAANLIFGGSGNDSIIGLAGNDTLVGGISTADSTDGSDTIYGSLGRDEIYGNAGNDTIYGGRAIADSEDEADVIYAGKGADRIYGNAGGDAIYGGGTGFDPSDEGDTIYGGLGADTLFGNGGNDSIFGGGDTFDPNDNADLLYGGAGSDYILGNGGNDSIYGHTGNDTMNAGVGDDIYYFDSISNGSDQILSFEGAGVAGGDILAIARNINNTGISLVSDVLARTTYVNGSAIIDLGSGFNITINGLGSTTLVESDISLF